jgi:hypothetical protein
MLQSGMTAGWDGGFSLGSADGNYKLNIGGLMQVRYVHSMRDNSGADDSVGGFENQRTYLTSAATSSIPPGSSRSRQASRTASPPPGPSSCWTRTSPRCSTTA